MGELSPVIEGHVKYREGKKVLLTKVFVVVNINYNTFWKHCLIVPYICMLTFMSNSAIYCSFYNFSGSLDMLGSFDYRQLQVNEKPKFCILFVLNFCTFPKDAFLI